METLPPKNTDISIGAAYIPASIMAEPTLTLLQKVLLGRVIGLLNKHGYCYASNKWIGSQIVNSGKPTPPKTVANNLVELNRKGFLNVEVIRNEKNEVVQRHIYLGGVFPLTGIPHPASGNTPHPASGKIVLENKSIEKSINIYKPLKNKNKYSSLKDLTPEVLQSLSDEKQIPLKRVEFLREQLVNHCQSKGKRYKNYKAALRTFINNDIQRDPSILKGSSKPLAKVKVIEYTEEERVKAREKIEQFRKSNPLFNHNNQT